MKKALIEFMKREKNDELYTPDYAIIPLIKYLPKNKIIWECTDFGESNITKCLKEYGYKVISTHIKNFNFLIDEPNFEYDIIITNPPYSLKDEFIERCYNLKKPFCLLLPITSLEGIKRGKMFHTNGIELLIFDSRISYLNNKNHVGLIHHGFVMIF